MGQDKKDERSGTLLIFALMGLFMFPLGMSLYDILVDKLHYDVINSICVALVVYLLMTIILTALSILKYDIENIKNQLKKDEVNNGR